MCKTQEQLRQTATNVLELIDALTRDQIEAMKSGDDERLMSLDKEIELAFGEKERSFGALHQHRQEHGC